jgi:hypothetical protein
VTLASHLLPEVVSRASQSGSAQGKTGTVRHLRQTMRRSIYDIHPQSVTSRIRPTLRVSVDSAVVGVDFPPPLPRTFAQTLWANLVSDHDDRLRVRIERMDASGSVESYSFIIQDEAAHSFRPVALNIEPEQAAALLEMLSTPAPLAYNDGLGRQHYNLEDVAMVLADYDPHEPRDMSDRRAWSHDSRIHKALFP